MAESSKDTIYIDIDDEITSIIDKVRGSSGQIVALVLPKRATTLQSIVNMKLLKRSADETKKNIVLVTTETGILPLAGAVGLHVAKTPTSRPEIPAAPAAAFAGVTEQIDEDVDLVDDGATPVGELAGSTMPQPVSKPDNGIETVELDNEDKSATAATAAAVSAARPKPKKDKKLHVPDFDRFRLILIFGGLLLLLLIVGGYVAFAVLPKATIAIKTNASNVNTNVDFTLSTSADTLSAKTVPAKQVQSQKTLTGNATATGQKNNGDKAAGSVSMTAQECAPNLAAQPSLPAGSALSANGSTYITQESAQFAYVNGKGSCINYKTTNAVAIKAQSPGAKYNTDSGTTFTVSGHADISGATGSASGGTDDIQTVISQADIDNAKGKISSSQDNVQGDLKTQLDGQGLYSISATYSTGTPATTTSAQVGDSASSVTVTQTITYTMLGAKQSDLQTLVDEAIKDQINASQQSILSRGITQSAFKLKNATNSGAAMNIQTTAEVGPLINTTTVAAQAAGKKSGEITATIKSNPDVTDVDVKLSPFWVSKAPKKVSKISVTVAKPTVSADAR